jgi:hypothetical protein
LYSRCTGFVREVNNQTIAFTLHTLDSLHAHTLSHDSENKRKRTTLFIRYLMHILRQTTAFVDSKDGRHKQRLIQTPLDLVPGPLVVPGPLLSPLVSTFTLSSTTVIPNVSRVGVVLVIAIPACRGMMHAGILWRAPLRALRGGPVRRHQEIRRYGWESR